MKISNSQFSNIIMFVAVVVMAFFLFRGANETTHAWKINAAKDDTLKITYNKLGQQTASISLLMGEKDDLLRLNSSQDSTLKKLQELVEKQKHVISATIFNTTTKNSGTSGTNLTSRSDTIRKDSLIYIYPEYKADFADKWRTVNILANKDSVQWDVVDFNEFQFVQRYERNGLLKPKTAIVEVTNLNPYTKTTELKSFTIQPPKKNKALVFFGGTAVGAALIIALGVIL